MSSTTMSISINIQSKSSKIIKHDRKVVHYKATTPNGNIFRNDALLVKIIDPFLHLAHCVFVTEDRMCLVRDARP